VPVIYRFDGYVIRMYFEDHNPPHVHVVGPDFEALVAIEDGTVVAGVLPAKCRGETLHWIAANRALLAEKWEEMH
jgi:hypothetical protein